MTSMVLGQRAEVSVSNQKGESVFCCYGYYFYNDCLLVFVANYHISPTLLLHFALSWSLQNDK